MTGRVDIVDSVGGQPVNSRPEGSGIRLLELQWKGVSMDKNYSEREGAVAGAVAVAVAVTGGSLKWPI